MDAPDIRWQQRHANYSKALGQLQKFIDKGSLNELEKQGLIHAFEYTYELAWNTLKDYFEYQGEVSINGSRDAFRLAFQRGLIVNGQVWMDMVKSRTLTSHTYNEEVVEQIAQAIVRYYYPAFVNLHSAMDAIKEVGQ